MKYEVALTEGAIDDLDALHLRIAGEAGEAVADAYLDRVQRRIEGLSEYANRGTPRDDLAPGVRTLSFERRLVIAYRVTGAEVRVLHIFSSQREYGLLFGV